MTAATEEATRAASRFGRTTESLWEALGEGLGKAIGLEAYPPVAEETEGEEELGPKQFHVSARSVVVPRDAVFRGR